MCVEMSNRTLPPCEVHSLGVLPYGEALELQRRLLLQRQRNEIPDQLLLLQHPHVITKGRNARDANILAGEELLRQRGVEVHEADRGGDVTYHGPGQLVAYPIIDLKPDRCDLHRYVRDLEKVLLATLHDLGIEGHTVAGRTGVWVGRPNAPEAKIAAIGVRVARWVTSHGIALNVAPDLDFFQMIVPCGLAQRDVTSVHEMLPAKPDVQEVGALFVRNFGPVFERRMIDG
jgi:lipoyl(octanoyl) transferase